MMPQGVEHDASRWSDQATSTVVFPLMPQGVEHMPDGVVLFSASHVVFPLMPQGVEHYRNTAGTLKVFACGFSVDAARR